MNQPRRLGRGLEALLGRSLDEAPVAGPVAPMAPGESEFMSVDDTGQRWLDLSVIRPNPFQPRKSFDEVEIADLADSIREHGVLQPLVVRRVDGAFELVAGERRLRAAQAAGWQRIPVLVRDVTDQQSAELALVENLQRKDLNAIEKATSFRRYLDQYDCTQEDLARRVAVDRSTVANLIRLLELPEGVQRMVVTGELSAGHARAILGLPADRREGLALRVVAEGLSVRRTEQEVQEAAIDSLAGDESEALRVVGSDGVSRQATQPRAAQIAALETELQKALGTKVEVRQTAKGKGRITLHFTSGDEFERLRAILTADGRRATGTL